MELLVKEHGAVHPSSLHTTMDLRENRAYLNISARPAAGKPGNP